MTRTTNSDLDLIVDGMARVNADHRRIVEQFHDAFFEVQTGWSELVEQIAKLDKPNSDPLVQAAARTLYGMTDLTERLQNARLFGWMSTDDARAELQRARENNEKSLKAAFDRVERNLSKPLH